MLSLVLNAVQVRYGGILGKFPNILMLQHGEPGDGKSIALWLVLQVLYYFDNIKTKSDAIRHRRDLRRYEEAKAAYEAAVAMNDTEVDEPVPPTKPEKRDSVQNKGTFYGRSGLPVFSTSVKVSSLSALRSRFWLKHIIFLTIHEPRLIVRDHLESSSKPRGSKDPIECFCQGYVPNSLYLCLVLPFGVSLLFFPQSEKGSPCVLFPLPPRIGMPFGETRRPCIPCSTWRQVLARRSFRAFQRRRFGRFEPNFGPWHPQEQPRHRPIPIPRAKPAPCRGYPDAPGRVAGYRQKRW